MSVTLAGRAVTEHDQGDRVLALQLGRVGQAHGVQRIGRQRGALGGDAVLVRVIPAVPVPPQQREHLNGIYAPAEGGHRVAVGREQPVLRAEREDRADLSRFLAARRRIHGQPSLPGQGRCLGVETPGQHHLPMQREEHVVAGHVKIGGPNGLAISLKQPQRGPGRKQSLGSPAAGDCARHRCHMRSDQGRQLVTILRSCAPNI